MQYENIMLVTSEEVGVEKPSKLIFEYALKSNANLFFGLVFNASENFLLA